MAEITNREFNSLDEFKNLMIKVLNKPKNILKAHWQTLSYEELINLLLKEVIEVSSAIDSDSSEEDVMEECADVANFAFFIYDNIQRYYYNYYNIKKE